MTGKYPEHAKLAAISDESQVVGEFVDWMTTRGVVLAQYVKDDMGHERLSPNWIPLMNLLAEFFDIDQNKIEREKRAMLEAQRALNDHEA